MVNMENYEEYMLLYADGELKPEEEQELLAFVAANPELEAELKAYAATRLLPDESIVFDNKESLLKTAEPARRIALGNWKMYAAAACVLLVAILFAIDRRDMEEIPPVAIAEETVTEPVTKNPSQPIQENMNDTALHSIAPKKKVHSTSPVNTIAVKQTQTKKTLDTDIKNQNQPLPRKQQETQNIANNRNNRDTAMQAIAQTNPKTKENKTPVENIATEQEPQQDDALPGKKTNRVAGFIAGILGDKPQGLEALEEVVDQKLMAVKEFGKEVKDTEVKLRLGKKELLIVRL